MVNEKRLISADPISNGIALYMAENAYLNDTALDVLIKVASWVNKAPPPWMLWKWCGVRIAKGIATSSENVVSNFSGVFTWGEM